jgi:hypothetical protein
VERLDVAGELGVVVTTERRRQPRIDREGDAARVDASALAKATARSE